MDRHDDFYRLSFADLAVDLSLTRAGTERARRIEQELRRRIAADECERVRHVLLVALCVGGLLALAGFTLGAYLRVTPPKDVQRTGPEKTELLQVPNSRGQYT